MMTSDKCSKAKRNMKQKIEIVCERKSLKQTGHRRHYGLNVSFQNSYVEALIPTVQKVGGGPLGGNQMIGTEPS